MRLLLRGSDRIWREDTLCVWATLDSIILRVGWRPLGIVIGLAYADSTDPMRCIYTRMFRLEARPGPLVVVVAASGDVQPLLITAAAEKPTAEEGRGGKRRKRFLPCSVSQVLAS